MYIFEENDTLSAYEHYLIDSINEGYGSLCDGYSNQPQAVTRVTMQYDKPDYLKLPDGQLLEVASLDDNAENLIDLVLELRPTIID